MNLTDDQKQKLESLDAQRRETLRTGSRMDYDKVTQTLKDLDQKIVDLLTEEQKAIWADHQVELKRNQ